MAQVLDRALCPVLVGRAVQLEALEDALLAANRAEGQVVVLAGEAGMGKTRLAEELQAVARRAGTVVMEGSCSEAELALPYLPLLEAIGNYLAIADVDALRERLGPFRRELAQLFPQVDPEASHGEGGDPTQGRLRLFEAVIALLRIPADAHGVLLIVEDIHWADASTRELLDYMTRRLRTTRIMVLATYRSDELNRRHPLLPLVQGWRRTGTARFVELEHLTPDGIAQMIAAIFDTDQVSDEFRDFLYERSEGNPFVAEELLKAALDRGDIYRTETGWERRELRELSLPRTVTDSVLLRLERLSEEETDILQSAAVLGRSFDYRTLAALAGPSEERVQGGLRLFVQQQLMEEETDTHRYRFRHALTREAIYQDLITPRRMDLHGRAADALRAMADTPPVDLAYHLLEAGRREDALPVALDAAAEAERRRGFREAVALYDRVVPMVPDEPRRAEIMALQGQALYWAGDSQHPVPLLERAIAVLEQHGRVADAAHFRLVLGRCYWEMSRPDRARAEYDRARDELGSLGPSADLATAYIRLAGLSLFEWDGDKTVELATRARDIAARAGADAARIWAEVFIASGMQTHGDTLEEAYARLEEASREATQAGYPGIAGNAFFNELETRIFRYGLRKALERVPLFRELQIRDTGTDAPWIPYLEGCAAVLKGQPEAGHALLTTAIQAATDLGFSTFADWARRTDALALSMLDRHEEARAALPGASGRQERQDAVPVAACGLRVLFDAGDLDGALAEVDAAIELLAHRRSNWVVEEGRLAEAIVEVLVAGVRHEDSRRVMDLVAGSGVDASDPYRLRAEGRWTLATGSADAAAGLLTRAAEGFARVEYRDEEWRTRRVLATALQATGRRDLAERELRQVLLEAREHGHVGEARCAGEALAGLGSVSAGTARQIGAKGSRGRSRRLAEGPAQPAASGEAMRAKRPSRGAAEPAPSAVRAGRPRPTEVVATVMFLDVRGYTALTGKRAPKDTVDRLATLHRWATKEVERHHGVVDKFAGDAVMAVFNVSGARLDHAVHALQAALAIRDKAAYAGMPVGIGLATGPAIVGKLTPGSNISAVGEATNLASRLQGAASTGEIVLSDETHRRVRDWLAERSLGADADELTLRGFERPVAAYRLR